MEAAASALLGNLLADTGPLLVLADANDPPRGPVARELALLKPPLTTCDAVPAEVTHRLRHLQGGRAALLETVDEGLPSVGFQIASQSAELPTLVKRDPSVPMSHADACRVRWAELDRRSLAWTPDSEFAT